jgi:hypothetical protein
MDPDYLEKQPYAQASVEVTRRLRNDWPSEHLPFAIADAHLSHLVAQVLAQTGVIDYWFVLRATSRDSYERARLVFGQVVAGTTAQLKQRGLPGATRRRHQSSCPSSVHHRPTSSSAGRWWAAPASR